MAPSQSLRPEHRREHGQIIVLFALGLVALVAGVGLIVDGGNAYAQQRAVQNGSDAGANAGSVVLAQRLGGVTKTDADVAAAITSNAGLNSITSTAYYTNVSGQPIDASGNATTAALAAQVGNGNIPLNAQGVHVGGNRTFGTTFAKVVGLNSFKASAEAIAVTGRLEGGHFLPFIFPTNITDCSGNGNLGLPQNQWPVSQPGTPPNHPQGTEFIVPLCKTGSGSFMILDFDGSPNDCVSDVTNPPAIQWDTFPVWVNTDNGNNCANPMVAAVNALQGQIVLIPICDASLPPGCNTSGGSNGQYHVSGVVAFYIDYMDDSNNKNNSKCQSHTNPDGQVLQTIAGNGSSSCIAGWFVHFITTGPVGSGPVGNTDAIGIQLIK
jgi:Flp pilus assembly protein TadG